MPIDWKNLEPETKLNMVIYILPFQWIYFTQLCMSPSPMRPFNSDRYCDSSLKTKKAKTDKWLHIAMPLLAWWGQILWLCVIVGNQNDKSILGIGKKRGLWHEDCHCSQSPSMLCIQNDAKTRRVWIYDITRRDTFKKWTTFNDY